MRRPRTRRFTFAEGLAALTVVAILVPVLAQAVGLAARVAQAGIREEQAARLADRELHEWIITGDWESADETGEFEEWPGYAWELTTDDWLADDDSSVSMTVVALTVSYVVQGDVRSVTLTTLAAPTEEQ